MLRNKYLYQFSRWLKISPRNMDDLTVIDFVRLRDGVDVEIRQLEDAARK